MDYNRYSRQLLLSEIGEIGQNRLFNSKVLIVGVGGLGSVVLTYLCRCGIGKVYIVDNECVDVSNLHRQILYTMNDIAKYKVNCATEYLQLVNPDCKIYPIKERLSSDNVLSLIKDVDIVVDCSDNFETRFLISDSCWKSKIPLVSGSVLGFDGQLLTIIPDKHSPCYRCLIPVEPSQEDIPGTGRVGIIGPTVGVIGSLQAMEVIKIICKIGNILDNRFLIYNGLKGEFLVASRKKDSNCPLCSKVYW